MRPLEILLAVANLMTFSTLAVPRLRTMGGLGYSAPVTVLIAVMQILIEGPRWQMVPAYALAGLFLLIRLSRNFTTAGGFSRIASTPFVVWIGIGLGVLGLLVSFVLPAVLPVSRIPRPEGPYRIGTVAYVWVDTGRQEVFSPDPDIHRQLVVQVWYPAGGSSSARAPYVENAGALSRALSRLVRLPRFFFRHFRYVTTNAVPSAPVAADEPGYPVLIFLAGLSGYRQMNTFQVEELVSHGYIVAAIDQPYAAATVVFPDGREIPGWTKDQLLPLFRQSTDPVETAPVLNGRPFENGIIPYFARDVSFTLDQLASLNENDPTGILTGRLDLERTGIFGISFGAVITGEACHMDPRLKACLMMDAEMSTGMVKAGLEQPAMWITRDADSMRLERRRSGGWPEAEISLTLTTMRAAFEKSQPGNGYYIQVPGMFHVNYTDAPFFSPLASRVGFSGPIDAERAHDIVNTYSVAFFQRYLENRSAPLLDGPPEEYREVLFERR